MDNTTDLLDTFVKYSQEVQCEHLLKRWQQLYCYVKNMDKLSKLGQQYIL